MALKLSNSIIMSLQLYLIPDFGIVTSIVDGHDSVITFEKENTINLSVTKFHTRFPL